VFSENLQAQTVAQIESREGSVDLEMELSASGAEDRGADHRIKPTGVVDNGKNCVLQAVW